jgi:endonuclease YncB( thermonuclease family)
MLKYLLALGFFLLSFPSYALAAETASQECKVIRVVDGDTLEVPLSCLPKDMKLFVRVLGVDTPEKGGRAMCPSEAALALKASEHTKLLVAKANSVAVVSNPAWDKFGGRMLANIKLGDIDLTQSLIAAGLARPYFGDKKQSWCQ